MASIGIKVKVEQEEDEAPDFPHEFSRQYEMFRLLKFGRMVSDGSLVNVSRGPLSFAEIESFCRLYGETLTGFDVRLIMDLDTVFEEVFYGRYSKPSRKS